MKLLSKPHQTYEVSLQYTQYVMPRIAMPRIAMTEKRLNNLLLLYVYKKQTDNLDLPSVAMVFLARNEERMKYFGNY